MSRFAMGIACAALLAGSAAAQQWEVGALGGFGFSTSHDVKRNTASASAKMKSGVAAGVYAGNHTRDRLSGELRYLYRKSDLDLGGAASMSARTHLIHYDALVWAGQKDASLRPYFAFGGGIKVFDSTGLESATQPLRNLALLTNATQIAPLLSVGGGVRVRVSGRTFVRVEVRDYFSKFPSKLIVPVPGATVSGFMHDITGLVGFGAQW